MTTLATATCTRLKTEVRAFRPVALQLLRLMGDPSVPFGKVADLVQTDPVLSMELLRIANSPLFTVRMEITRVLQAIVFLGSDMVSALVVTTCLKALADKPSSRILVDCWRHSLATALICQRLSEAWGITESNGYTAGLIHDIGRLALLNVFPAYETALVSAGERGTHFLDVEREMFGLDHGEAGRWLLAQWGCPLELQDVAAKHENPPQAQAREGNLVRLVHGASAMADLMGMSVLESDQREDLSQIAALLPEAGPELTAEGFLELSQSVMIKINGVEISLGFSPTAERV
ncbi:MAG: HDOD domain-containing protein [Bryobacteraceae bacterium]